MRHPCETEVQDADQVIATSESFFCHCHYCSVFNKGKSGKMAHRNIKNNPPLTSEASIWFNSQIRIAKKTFCWNQWAKVGILHLGNLYDKGHMVSFEQLKQHYSLTNTEFWKYLQLRHCLLSVMSSGPDPSTEIQNLLQHVSLKKRQHVSLLQLHQRCQRTQIRGLKLSWGRDIGESIKQQQWNKVISSPGTVH